MADVGGSVTVSVGPLVSNIAAEVRRMSIREAGNGDTPQEIFFDVFPSDSLLDVSSTSGSIGFPSERFESIFEILTFNNSDEAQLTHGNVDNLTLTKIGNFRDKDGFLLSSSIVYDADSSTVRLTQKVFGNVKATYDAPFRRYSFIFSGDCPASRPPINSFSDEEEEIFERATIIAILPSTLGLEEAVVSLSLFNSNDRCPFPVDKGEENKIVLEIGKSGFFNKANIADPNFFTRINVFPSLSQLAGAVEVDVNVFGPGVLIEPKPCTTTEINVTNEFVAFNNSISGSIRYPLEAAFTAEPQSLTDEFGDLFPATEDNIAHVGETVNIGVWKRNNIFISSGQTRIVKKGEIYVVDAANNAKPVFGAVKVNYTATIDVYLYKHEVIQEGTNRVTNSDVFTIRRNELVGILPLPGRFIATPNFTKPTEDCEF